MQGVQRKRRASLGLTTCVASIWSVPSPRMGRRNVTSNSSGRQRQTAGVIVERNENRKRLTIEDIADEAERHTQSEMPRKDTMMKNWRMIKRWSGKKPIHATRTSLDEGDLILSRSIGPSRSFLCWNSSVRRISDEITESGGNLEHCNGSTRHPRPKSQKSSRRRGR